MFHLVVCGLLWMKREAKTRKQYNMVILYCHFRILKNISKFFEIFFLSVCRVMSVSGAHPCRISRISFTRSSAIQLARKLQSEKLYFLDKKGNLWPSWMYRRNCEEFSAAFTYRLQCWWARVIHLHFIECMFWEL